MRRGPQHLVGRVGLFPQASQKKARSQTENPFYSLMTKFSGTLSGVPKHHTPNKTLSLTPHSPFNPAILKPAFAPPSSRSSVPRPKRPVCKNLGRAPQEEEERAVHEHAALAARTPITCVQHQLYVGLSPDAHGEFARPACRAGGVRAAPANQRLRSWHRASR